MNTSPTYRQAVNRLKSTLLGSDHSEVVKGIIDSQEEVLTRYQPLFTPRGIGKLTAEEFRDFLMFRNNRHWSGLQRLGPQITAEMSELREALLEIVDETISAADRLDSLLPLGTARVHKLGKAVITPILMICHPDRYGVWNGTSEGGVRELGLWPNFERGASIGEKYTVLNALLLDLARAVGTDMWTLDALWWAVVNETVDEDPDEEDISEGEGERVHFGLERHLHDFLFDNWEKTELGEEWVLHEEGGDTKGYGYERPTSVGKIDLLARHRSEPRWLVIELKRGQSSDDTLGQVQRYMGWIQEELATAEETVEGLIIARSQSEKLRYALKASKAIRFQRYEVDFRLVEEE
jgi:hypothetical protein